MKVLVVGGGGREHALCWALARSPHVSELVAAPGNAGIADVARVEPVRADDVGAVAELAERERADLTVVGPEAPLVAGLADELGRRGLRVFGPDASGARLEGSKAWARALCERHGIPVPASRTFSDPADAFAYLESLPAPYVVKADGLAAGKGVTVTDDVAEARRAVDDALVRGAFGDAGRRVVIEEFLDGFEVSAMALTDGKALVPLALAQDHKRAFDGDTGPNTGGMGAVSPVARVDGALQKTIVEDVLRATVAALAEEGVEYRGVVYAGLMVTDDGPKVLEFNCRFGDPETQVVLPRLDEDLFALLMACAGGELPDREARWSDEACVGVVVASRGYPGAYETGMEVRGIAEAEALEGVRVFHSGTTAAEGRVLTAGGRVLTVTARAPDVREARTRAYTAVERIRFEGMTFRRDIGG